MAVRVARLRSYWRTFLADEEGATAIEYGVVLALLGVVVITAVAELSDELIGIWTGIAGEINEELASNGGGNTGTGEE